MGVQELRDAQPGHADALHQLRLPEMSERSTAWYAIPANAERRKVNMRAYARALVILGQRYPAQRDCAYRVALSDFTTTQQAAYQRAYGIVRDAHPEEFREIVHQLRAGT